MKRAALNYFYFPIIISSICWRPAFSQTPVPPAQKPFEPLELPVMQTGASRPFVGSSNPLLMTGQIEEQNRKLLLEHDMLPGPTSASSGRSIPFEVEKDIEAEDRKWAEQEWLNKTASYRQALDVLLKMSSGQFSISEAVYVVENAFLDGKLPRQRFFNAIAQRADQVKLVLKKQRLDTQNNLALNYGIQKLYAGTAATTPQAGKPLPATAPFTYNFEDYDGKKDFTSFFASRLLATGKGQCHSLPLVYLMIAEQLGAKAWLSLAPQHSFIRFMDSHGNLMNFETTSGLIVSESWLYQSGYITASALKQKTYLDTLSEKALQAQCLADLLAGYMQKFGYDGFADHIRKKIQELNSRNLSALIVDANVKTAIAMRAIHAAGKPSEKDLPKYPQAYRAYLAMHAAYEKVDATGYQDMPKEAYQKWLKSVEQEKDKQQINELNSRIQTEIKLLKTIKR